MEPFSIIEQLDTKQTQQLLDLLHKTWWGKDRTMQDVATTLKKCLSFGLIENISGKLIGYARVLTDEIKYAFIFDVMVDEPYRKKGLGDVIMKAIIAHPKLQCIKNFELTCAPDLIKFYERFGFSEDYDNVTAMRFKRIPMTSDN